MKKILKSVLPLTGILLSSIAAADGAIYTIESVDRGVGIKNAPYQNYLAFFLQNRDQVNEERIDVFVSFVETDENLSYQQQLNSLPKDVRDESRCGADSLCYTVHYPVSDFSKFLSIINNNKGDTATVVEFDKDRVEFQLRSLTNY